MNPVTSNSNTSNSNNNFIPASTVKPSPDTLDIREKETTVVMNDYERIARDKDGFVNTDEVNLMTRTRISTVRSEEEPDAIMRKPSFKPANYAARKTVAQGMMDIALLTSNANQLKNLIEFQNRSTITFWFVFTMIVTSLILQILVGVSLIFKGRFDNKRKDKAAAARVNMWLMSGVFMITIINIFIAVFSTGAGNQRNDIAATQ